MMKKLSSISRKRRDCYYELLLTSEMNKHICIGGPFYDYMLRGPCYDGPNNTSISDRIHTHTLSTIYPEASYTH